MTDKELIGSVYKQKGLSVDMAKAGMYTHKYKEKNMKELETDLSIFDNKKVSNVVRNIQMTVIEGKLGVLNKVSFNLVENDDEVVESSFFAGADSKINEIKCEAYFIIGGSFNSVENAPEIDWVMGYATKFNVDVYPDDMAEIISKTINMNKGIGKGFDKDDVIRFSSASGLETMAEFLTEIDMTKKAFDDLTKEITRLKSINGSADINDFLDRYYFRKHLLIQGEKGGGKTYSVDKKLRDEGIDTEFMTGHEGIEAIDMLGYYVKTDTGDLVWLDGALTKAFRKALDGKVAFFIDEMLRIPTRELNILVGSLTPSSVGTYRLRTNRIINIVDSIGETEVIEIPMDNLWAVGTTNVGAGYQVDEIDDALADRFRVVNKITSNSELESILISCADKSAIDNKIVPKLVEFYSQIKDMVASGELEKNVNTRHLCEVLTLSKDVSEVKMYMFDLIPTWTSTDTNGQPNRAERDIITKMIKKILK